jgi:transcription elongation factor Elf1
MTRRDLTLAAALDHAARRWRCNHCDRVTTWVDAKDTVVPAVECQDCGRTIPSKGMTTDV